MQSSDFKDLVVWQKAMGLCMEVYRLTKRLPPEELYGLTSQMRRCAVSIPSNIAEGHGRNTYKEELHFLAIAKGSLSELETQYILCESLGYLDRESLTKTIGLAKETGRLIKGYATYLHSKHSTPKSP